VKKFDTSICGGSTTNYWYETAALTSGTDLATCKAACDLLEDECMEFMLDAGSCKGYSGKCTSSAGTSDQHIYERVPCCYWTSPTEIQLDGVCANREETTMNGAANSGNSYDFTILNNNNANYDLQSCHKLCAEYADNCQSFGYKSSDSTACNLYLQGVCTATAGDGTTDLYARSDFKEFPYITTNVCTHRYLIYEDPVKVHECKELTDDGELACVRDGVYYSLDEVGGIGLANFACGVTADVGAFGGDTGGNKTVFADGAITTDLLCAAECTAARDYCQWYTWDNTASG
jgi:hypothetical protein